MNCEERLRRGCVKAAGAMVARRQYGYTYQDMDDLASEIYARALPMAQRFDGERLIHRTMEGMMAAWVTLSIERSIAGIAYHRSRAKRHWALDVMAQLDESMPDPRGLPSDLTIDVRRALGRATHEQKLLADSYMDGSSTQEHGRKRGMSRKETDRLAKGLRRIMRHLEVYVSR